MIYFILDTVVRAIKIGYSKKPKNRLSGLQTANPNRLDLLGIIPGTEREETQLHLRFADYRLQGEWFKGDDILEAVLELIAANRPAKTVRTVQGESGDMGENKKTVDAGEGMQGVSRLPGLKLGAFTLKLTESEPDQSEQIRCGYELKYVLIFEQSFTPDEFNALHRCLSAQQGTIQHYFLDEDGAVIPFVQATHGGNGCHIAGGFTAVTGIEGEGFRVVVYNEMVFRRAARDDSNYPGEHPLKRARKLVARLLGYPPPPPSEKPKSTEKQS
jgi:hypothetical protein